MASFFDKLINRSVTANAGGEPEPLDEEVADSSVEETATSSEMRTLKKNTRSDSGIAQIRLAGRGQ